MFTCSGRHFYTRRTSVFGVYIDVESPPPRRPFSEFGKLCKHLSSQEGVQTLLKSLLEMCLHDDSTEKAGSLQG